MILSELTAIVRGHEASAAPGSETGLWGRYCERMRQLTGILPYNDTDEDPEISAEECAWWLQAIADAS